MTDRAPAVAGLFYAAEAATLGAQVNTLLADAGSPAPVPKAIIAPHAGYVYSGPVAATAYNAVAQRAPKIERVVLIGPAHHVFVHGLATSSAAAFVTPLGPVALARATIDALAARFAFVSVSDEAHAPEHSLEVHLPFLQQVLGPFELIPLVVGDADPQDVASVLEELWGGEETLIVISSDLSHYHDYATAQRLDRATSEAIESLLPERIDSEQACGRIPVCGLLHVAQRRGLCVHAVDLRNSGDTAGPKDRVVGYGAWLFD